MVPHIAAGFFGLWPVFIFPVFGIDAAGSSPHAASQTGTTASQTGTAASPEEPKLHFVYSLSCADGDTGEKRFATADDFCSALRSEQVCPDTAKFIAMIQGCP